MKRRNSPQQERRRKERRNNPQEWEHRIPLIAKKVLLKEIKMKNAEIIRKMQTKQWGTVKKIILYFSKNCFLNYF